jgi:hypothetical protein
MCKTQLNGVNRIASDRNESQRKKDALTTFAISHVGLQFHRFVGIEQVERHKKGPRVKIL